jgi:hypothetical protein
MVVRRMAKPGLRGVRCVDNLNYPHVLEIIREFAGCPLPHYFWREEYDYHRNPGRRVSAIFELTGNANPHPMPLSRSPLGSTSSFCRIVNEMHLSARSSGADRPRLWVRHLLSPSLPRWREAVCQTRYRSPVAVRGSKTSPPVKQNPPRLDAPVAHPLTLQHEWQAELPGASMPLDRVQHPVRSETLEQNHRSADVGAPKSV